MSAARHEGVDALRGIALAWMALYHFAFDLNHAGYLQTDFHHDPVWTLQRTAILGLFLFCAGFGQALARHNAQGWPRFWRRWAMIAGCAALVSLGSWWMFPRSFIYFGVLHGMTVMLVLARLTAGWGMGCLVPAALALAAPLLATGCLSGSLWEAQFNAPALNWLGLVTRKPITEDYVPLLPWMGVVWLGVAAGSQWCRRCLPLAGRVSAGWLAAAAWLGRRSLRFYMVHQPVLLAALGLYQFAAR